MKVKRVNYSKAAHARDNAILNGLPAENVACFDYSGSNINIGGESVVDIEKRMTLAIANLPEFTTSGVTPSCLEMSGFGCTQLTLGLNGFMSIGERSLNLSCLWNCILTGEYLHRHLLVLGIRKQNI